MESLNTTKVPISSLIGKTPVTVRFANGTEKTYTGIRVVEHGCSCKQKGEHAEFVSDFHLIEVLPAKETPTPLTDAEQWETDEGYEVVDVDFASNLEIDRAALLALVERVASGSILGLRADARALLAQLKP